MSAPPYPDAAEDPLLSPQQVVTQLRRRGWTISPRTVERYYHQDKFPGAFQRERSICIPQSGLDHYVKHGVRRP